MRHFDWWEDLRVRHDVRVGPYCVRWSQEDRRSGEGVEEVLSFEQALSRAGPPELRALLSDPEGDEQIASERAEQRGWLLRWRTVPLDEELGGLKQRALTPLGLGRLAALRTDRAMLNTQAMPMQLMGVVGQATLGRPHHFATSGFAQRGLFVLEQHGHVFVVDEQAQVRASTLGMGGWGLPPYRLSPVGLDQATLVVEISDPSPEDRDPELRALLGESTRLRWHFAEGWVGRKAL